MSRAEKVLLAVFAVAALVLTLAILLSIETIVGWFLTG